MYVCALWQALILSSGDLSQQQSLKIELEELNKLLPTETLTDDQASKEKLAERLTSGSASLVHFLGHGTSVGKRLVTISAGRWMEDQRGKKKRNTF